MLVPTVELLLIFQDPHQMIISVKSSQFTVRFNHGRTTTILLLIAFAKPPPAPKKSSLDILQRKADSVTPSNYRLCRFESGRSSGGLGEREEKLSRYTGAKGTSFQTDDAMRHPHCVCVRGRDEGQQEGPTVVRNVPSAREAGSIPGPGTKIPRAMGQLSLCDATAESVRHS